MTYLIDKNYADMGIDPELINPASYNVTLKTIRRMTEEWLHFIKYPNFSEQLVLWGKLGRPDIKDVNDRDKFFGPEHLLEPGVDYLLLPGEYALFCTEQCVHFQNGYAGLLFIRSGDARGGADQFNTFIDPGFKGELVLEIINHAPWPKYIRGGQQIAQILTLVGPNSLKSYEGSYQHQKGAEPPR